MKPKKKTGAKKVSDKMVHIRVSKDDHAKLKKVAADRGTSVQKHVHALISRSISRSK